MDLMRRRREILAQGNGLPSAYEQIEWIHMPSGAYIDTGYAPIVAPKIETRFHVQAITDSDVFGFANSTSPLFTVNCSNYGANWYNRWGSTTATIFHQSIQNKVADCIFGQNTVIDGVAQTAFEDTDWSSNVQTMRIGGGRTTTLAVSFYTCKMYDGNSLVGNYIPCVRKSDSVAGMYDTVTKTFFTNAGTGSFSIPT